MNDPKYVVKIKSDFTLREIVLEVLEVVALVVAIGLFYWILP